MKDHLTPDHSDRMENPKTLLAKYLTLDGINYSNLRKIIMHLLTKEEIFSIFNGELTLLDTTMLC